MPKISVIMPLYNAKKYVKGAIESILKQTYEDFELLIIDDCSTDGSLDIASDMKDSRIKIISNEENRGIAFSRNKGLELVDSQYIALMDHDDLTVINRFELQVDYLESHNDIDVVGGRQCVIDQNDQVMRAPSREMSSDPKYIRADLMLCNRIANGSTMIRNNFLKENKIRYQDGCLGMEDYHFWIDCSVKGKITNLNDVLLYWRDSGNNETFRMQKVKSKQRAERFSELQRYAFEMNHYSLMEEEYEIINNMFPERLSSAIVNVEDMKKLHNIFLKVIHQSKEMGAENANEVAIMCRKRFSNRLEFSDLWF